MARDILAIQMTSVASESTFSTGGRVVTDHRSRLLSTIVEVILCIGDWLRDFNLLDNLEDVSTNYYCDLIVYLINSLYFYIWLNF